MTGNFGRSSPAYSPQHTLSNNVAYDGDVHGRLGDTQGYPGQHTLSTVMSPGKPSMVDATDTRRYFNRTRIFMLSASDKPCLTNQIQQFKGFVQDHDHDAKGEWMNNLAYTVNESRMVGLYRAAVIGESAAKLKDRLSVQLKIYKASKRPTIGFVFTGQGAQWPGMGKELLETYPVFRQSMERIESYMSQIGASFKVIDEILQPSDISRLDHPLFSQPICSALQIALVDLLASWGIYPDSLTGHSSGEIAAAYSAGILSMEDAITVASVRGVLGSRLFKMQSKGAMMAVGMSAAEVEPFVDALVTGKATVACVNSPSSVTISGDDTAIEELKSVLKEKKVLARRLAVDVAYHSHHMDLIAEEYLQSIAHIKPQGPGTAQFFSSVTGAEIPSTELGPQYWLRNLVEQVKFVDSIQTLCFETNGPQMINPKLDTRHSHQPTAEKEVGVDTLVEIGPHAALAGPIRQIIRADSRLNVASVAYNSVLIQNTDATTSALTVAASLECTGYPVDFQAINDPVTLYERRALVDFPPYTAGPRSC